MAATPIPPAEARARWRSFETVHAVTYFAQEARTAADDIGLVGFWMGYFAFRAAPMGAVGPGPVVAAFANFAPWMVSRALPDAWDRATPEAALDARSASAAAALRRLVPDVDHVAEQVVEDLQEVVRAGDPTGRPLFAANLDVDPPTAPVAALWQACTALREHRGDGHVAALVAEGLSGLDSHLLQVASDVVPADRLRSARGWTEDEWASAGESLGDRGLLGSDGRLTDAGRAVRARVEDTTDRLAAMPWAALPDSGGGVVAALEPLAEAIRATGAIPVPNPIGLA